MLRRSRGPEAAALVWAVGSRWGFAARLAQVGEAAESKNSEREPHAQVPGGDLAELVASDECDVRPEVPAAVQADQRVGVEGIGALGNDLADRCVAHVALQVERLRRRPDHADLAANTVAVAVGVEIESGDPHILELGIVKAEAAVEARCGRERVGIADTDPPAHHVEITLVGVDAVADLEFLTGRRILTEHVHVLPELPCAADEAAAAGIGLELERAVVRERPGLLHVVDEAGDVTALEVGESEILCARSCRRAQRDHHGKCEHPVISRHTFNSAWNFANFAGHHGLNGVAAVTICFHLYRTNDRRILATTRNCRRPQTSANGRVQSSVRSMNEGLLYFAYQPVDSYEL